MMCSEARKPRSGAQRRAPKLAAMAVLFTALVLGGCSDSPDRMLDSARDYLAENDLNAASIQLKNALQKDGSLAEARFLLGSVYLEQGDYAGSVRELRRAINLGFPEDKVAPLLAEALVMSGEFDKVLGDFSGTTLEDRSGQSRLLVAIGDAHIGLRQVDKARDSYRSALDTDAANVSAWIGLGRSKFFMGDLDGALADADAALAVDAATGEAHALRADVFAARDQLPEAIAALEAALKSQPRAVNYHFSLISMLLARNDLDAAEQRLPAMRSVAARHPSTLYLKAFIDFRRDRLPEARDAITDLLRQLPDHLPAQLLAGNIHFRLNEHAMAQDYLERVLARSPGQRLARRALAASLLATGEPAKAKDVLEPMLSGQSADIRTLSLAGQVYLATGDFDRASDYFASVVAADPDNVSARTRLGVTRLASGDVDQAMADLESASQLDDTLVQPDVALVLAHLRRGDLDKAVAAHEELARKQPDIAMTHHLKGGILLAQQDLAAAREAFLKVLEIQPNFLAAAVNLARIDLAEKGVEVARGHFDKIIAHNPGSADAYVLLAGLLEQTGAGAAEVRSVLEEGVKASSGAHGAKLALARHHLLQKRTSAAISLAQEVVAAAPNNPAAVETLARAQFASGEHQQAVSSFTRFARLQPQAPEPLILLAEAQRVAGDRSGAEQSLRRALAMRPGVTQAEQRLLAFLMEANRPGEALSFAREVQKQRPEAAVGHVYEGDIHVASGNWGEAVAAFQRGLDRSRTADLVIRLHAAQLRAGKPADAERTSSAWLSAEPSDLQVRSYLAQTALGERRYEDAESIYREMVAIGPDSPLVLNNLAWVAGQLKRSDAIELAERALALAPDNAAILDTLGMLQVDAGMHEKGVENLRKAVAQAPQLPALRLNLARAHATMGMTSEAGKEIDEVLKLAPEGSPVYEEASRLKMGL